LIIGPSYKEKFHDCWDRWLKVKHNKINYGMLVANWLAHYCHYPGRLDKEIALSKLFVQCFKALIYFDNSNPFEWSSEGKILFMHTEDNRKDYEAQCEYVLFALKEFDVTELKINKHKISSSSVFIFSRLPGKIILGCKVLFRVFFTKSLFSRQALKINLHFLIRSFQYHDLSITLKKYPQWTKIKLLITFSDMKEYGNLLTQIAKMYRIKTVTLQHAIYFKFNDTSYSQPVINYENFSSDFIFAWGESLREQWSDTKVKNENIVVAGTNVLSYKKRIEDSNILTSSGKNVGLIMSAEYWHASNIRMLNIALSFCQQHEYTVQILFHPTNNIADYISEFPPLSSITYFQGITDFASFINGQRFLICHTTTLYLTCLQNAKRCFRFLDDFFIDIGGLDDMFTDISSLSRLFNTGIDFSAEDIKSINKLLEFHFGGANVSYENAVKEIMHE